MRTILTLGLAVFSFSAGPASGGVAGSADGDYVVVSLVPESDPYFAAARELERLRSGRIVKGDAARLNGLLPELRRVRPGNVAVVLRPEMLDENLARKFLVLSTKVDEDPFVDFAYGFITGDSPEVAVALAAAGSRSERRPKQAEIAMLAVAGGELKASMSSPQVLPLRKGMLKQTVHAIAAGESANAIGGDELHVSNDEAFIRDVMPTLAGAPIVLFAGHGYPRQVVGGPTYRDLSGQRFDGAVVMNIACYTGVTERWFDSDWRSGKIRAKKIPMEESFCLNMLKTGVAGYVAYVSPRPAGPAMFGDAITLATEGQSIGELIRSNTNSVVMAHLQQGQDGLHVDELKDGAPLAAKRGVQNVLLAMSTGGVLFGDPAHVPFQKRTGENPARVTVKRKEDSLIAQAEVAGPLFHFFCSDQVAMWEEGKQSLKLEATVPLGDRYATDVRLASSTLGDVPHRLIACSEEHAGKRYLHVKAAFEQPEPSRLMEIANGGLSGSFEIKTSNERPGASVIRHEEAR